MKESERDAAEAGNPNLILGWRRRFSARLTFNIIRSGHEPRTLTADAGRPRLGNVTIGSPAPTTVHRCCFHTTATRTANTQRIGRLAAPATWLSPHAPADADQVPYTRSGVAVPGNQPHTLIKKKISGALPA